MIKLFRNRKSPQLKIYNFHQVTDIFDPKRHHPGTWTQFDLFKKNIIKLKRQYPILRLQDAIAQLEAGELNSDSICITFDDGDISLKDFIVPFLKTENVPATFFVNSHYVQRQDIGWHWIMLSGELNDIGLEKDLSAMRQTRNIDFYQKTLARIPTSDYAHLCENYFIDMDFLAGLKPDLFSVGCHGTTHERFSMMSSAWKVKAIKEDINALKSLPAYIPYFAIPFGRPHDWDDETVKIALQNALKIVTANGGVNGEKDILYKRISMDGKKI